MIKLIILFLFTSSAFADDAVRHNWIHAPGGVLPDPTQSIITYWNESDCGNDCVSMDKGDGTFATVDTAAIVDGHVVDDADKVVAKQNAAAAANTAHLARRALLKNITGITDPQARAVIIAIVKELGFDK